MSSFPLGKAWVAFSPSWGTLFEMMENSEGASPWCQYSLGGFHPYHSLLPPEFLAQAPSGASNRPRSQ